MFLPIHDNTVLRLIRFQFVTGIILLINVVIFVYTHVLIGGSGEVSALTSLGAIPALFSDTATLDPSLQLVPEPATLLTYMFFHAGWLHLIANMAFLWVFADNVEDSFGHGGFLLFYLICGIVSALAHIYAAPASKAPLVGASGAVSGVMAAYLVLFPRARVWVLLFMKLPLRISALWALAGWFAFQVVSLLATKQDGTVIVAWWAHIGGFLVGLLITFCLLKLFRARFAGE
ncbi:MAG: rhomboid family intramembrane serine protease [Rhizobiales bacterium]|nr:rhomboid family intramembrane serine protease [Hyphomicrobiales bacterium]